MPLGLVLPLAFVFGAVIGSFLNVVIFRMNTGVGLGGRSRCMKCARTLTTFELIPILSFMMQMGRCRGCKVKLSWQYPLIELCTAILFTLIFWKFSPFDGTGMISNVLVAWTIFYMIVASLLIVITVYDARHKIIPDSLVFVLDILAFASLFFTPTGAFHTPHAWTILAGPLLAFPFAFLWLISKGKWIGLGDSKLVLGLGWLLGMSAGINALAISFWIGAAVGILMVLRKYGTFKRNVEIPFGPFLIIGALIVLFFHIQVIDVRLLSVLF